MIQAAIGKLEGVKVEIQAAIEHFKSGVLHLNEEQQEKARELLNNIDTHWARVKAETLAVIGKSGVEEVKVPKGRK